jgi:CubicO group peptidase (beta-lactamase class C family)
MRLNSRIWPLQAEAFENQNAGASYRAPCGRNHARGFSGLSKEVTRERAWIPLSMPDGRRLPYTLGWFVQPHQGNTLVWHYGHMLEASSLIVKIPARRITFVVLANSDGLSRWRSLGDDADIAASPAATLFLSWARARITP